MARLSQSDWLIVVVYVQKNDTKRVASLSNTVQGCQTIMQLKRLLILKTRNKLSFCASSQTPFQIPLAILFHHGLSFRDP